MIELGKLRAAPDGDRRILVTRSFDAPREEVFDAYTKPEQVQRWFGTFGGWWMSACEIEPRVGGEWRFVWRGPDGKRMGLRARCTEFEPPERLSTTAVWDEPWFSGEERRTVLFDEHGSSTILTLRLRYDSTAIRDEVLRSPALQGMALSFDNLEEHLRAPADNWMDAEAGVP